METNCVRWGRQAAAPGGNAGIQRGPDGLLAAGPRCGGIRSAHWVAVAARDTGPLPRPDRFAICAFIGPVGRGMSAMAIRSAVSAAS